MRGFLDALVAVWTARIICVSVSGSSMKFHLFGLFLLLSQKFVNGFAAHDVQQQYFRVEPKDVRAQVGSQVTLPCEVEFLKGRVQWTKDGFALGFESEILGYENYRMIGDSSHGIFNLQIKNISLNDDAEFECQVGPNRTLNVSSIRASANLTVLSPPESVEMIGLHANQQVKIKENEELTLECLVRKSKPPAKIIWYRDTSELKLDKPDDKVTESNPENMNPRMKLFDVTSKIRLTPSADDDGVKYSCEAQHETLPSDMAMRKSVQLSVLYTFKDPYIEGYDPKKDVLRRGQLVELECRSMGGNPPPQLVWYRNGEEIKHQTTIYGRMTVNVYPFKADTKDNNATYTCKASSVANPVHKKAETTLTVNYAPIHVIILGSTQAKVGDSVQLNCTAGPSNPAASIRWQVDGRQVFTNNSQTVRDPENGWSTSSTTSIFITPDKTNIVVICHGVNTLLNEIVIATHNINVLYPPGEPTISGYERGKYIESGAPQRLMCKSTGGNPLANLTWYKNDKEIHSVTKTEKNNFVYSEIQFLVNSTDNDAIYKCSAKNDAIDIPLFQTVKFNVYFPPDNVVIRKEPKDFHAGSIGKLICDASSSNPEANLTFWRDGIEIESISRKSKPGLHGGNTTSIVTQVNITADMDGNLFTCQAQNPKLNRNVHNEIRLSVFYKPIFEDLNETVFWGVEGDSLVVPLFARGHPSSLTYTWSKNGVPLVHDLNYLIDGSTLNFTKLGRSDVGNYSCEAINKEGSSFMNFSVNVQYSATISSYSNAVMVSENEDAELWCVIDAYPLSSEHVTWRKPGFPLETRTSRLFVNNTSYLTVRGVTRKDMGQFFCVADNGLGNETSRAVFLAVKHKPEIFTSPVLSKAAAKPNGTGRLVCKASGAPKPVFAWSKDGHSISVNTTRKYHARYNQLDPITYESVLSIHGIEANDYGSYQCKATNSLGFKTHDVHFSLPTRPDPPQFINLVNLTHSSVTITWEPGFDGGEPCTYSIRYRDLGASSSGFSEISRNVDDTTYTVSNLLPGTSYAFSVSARNTLGSSDYVKNMLKATTTSDPQPTLSHVAATPPRMSLVIGAVVVLILIVANLLLLVFCLLKRSRKQIVAGANEQSSNKSGTIEMYAPSSYNETMTGETLSSVSEKSETYSDTRQDYNECRVGETSRRRASQLLRVLQSHFSPWHDEKKRNGGNAYMIEQIDYPFQYPGYDTHPKEHNSIGHHRNPYMTHNGTGYQSENSSRYSSTADPRYVTYPPPVQFAQPSLAPNGTLRRGTVPPPDVTVLTAPPPVSLSTFNYGGSETEGHLV